MWEAEAEYPDGTIVKHLFEYNSKQSDEEQRNKIYDWLIAQHPDCLWYTVNYVSKWLLYFAEEETS